TPANRYRSAPAETLITILPVALAALELPDRVCGSRKGIRGADDRCHLSLFHHRRERLEVFAAFLRVQGPKLLLRPDRQERRAQLAAEAARPAVPTLASDDHERARRRERSPKLRYRTPARGVDDEIPGPRSVREILPRVVDHVVGADRTDQIRLRGSADPRDPRAERLRDLVGERADTSARTHDQGGSSRPCSTEIPNGSERAAPGDRGRGRLLERDAARRAGRLVGLVPERAPRTTLSRH